MAKGKTGSKRVMRNQGNEILPSASPRKSPRKKDAPEQPKAKRHKVRAHSHIDFNSCSK